MVEASGSGALAALGPIEARYPELECVAVEDLARLLGKSEGWLYTLIRQQRFPHVKAGGSVLLPRRLVARWLEAEFDASVDAARGVRGGRVDSLAARGRSGRGARR